jgi:Domain of unknown function (DUF4832)
MHNRQITPSLTAISLLFMFIMLASPIPVSAAWISQTYKAGPVDNPLKGFMPYHGSFTTFPYSMEWQYLAWKDLQTDSNTFTWAPLDNLLNEVAARGHQLVFRIYADYPTEPYGVPAFLSSVPKNSYTDYGNTTSFSPDYDNADLRRAMHNLIVALGKRYDGDPRIGFITVGLIGFWGEWHTYRPSCNCDTWMPSTAVLDEVLGAFDSSFTKTKILMRMPKGTNPAARSIGYHDDSFNYETYGSTSWFFWPAITAAGSQNKWRTEAIGGELRPEIQLTTWQSADQCVTGGDGSPQCFNTAVDTTHASWMIAHALFEPGNSGTEHTRALAGSQRMGYDLFVSWVNLPDTVRSDSLQVSIRIQNRGVAPFYYDWPVQLAAFDNGRHVAVVWPTAWKLTSVIDRNTDAPFSFVQYPHGLAAGTYTVLMRAVNPLTNGKPLCFANSSWAQDTAGWLTLGSCMVASSFVSLPRSNGPGRKGSLPRFSVFTEGGGIRFECSRPVVVSLYDVNGRCTACVALQNEAIWRPVNKEGISAGIFLAVARDGAQTIARRLIVVE